MARLLCPGSTAPSPNQPSGLSHQTLMQVPVNVGRRRIDKCIERERKRESRKKNRGRKRKRAGDGGIKIVPASTEKCESLPRDLLLSLCSTAPVHAYRANSVPSIPRTRKKSWRGGRGRKDVMREGTASGPRFEKWSEENPAIDQTVTSL